MDRLIKVFGLIWNRIEDYLQIPSFKVSLDEYDITKQQVLSDVSKYTYDLLGLINLVTLWGRLFSQKLWSTIGMKVCHILCVRNGRVDLHVVKSI